MEQHDVHIFESGGLNEMSRAYLLETSRWTKFLAIMGFIATGIMVLAAFFMMAMGSTMGALAGSSASMMGGLMGVGMGMIYILVAAIYIYPVITLYKFSRNMKRGLQTNNNDLVTEAFRNQKNLYKFLGILMIILLAFYLMAFIFAGIGLMGGSRY